MAAGDGFMYVPPAIQNLIRDNKSFRIDSEIQTGKRYGMQLLDDNLWTHFTAGRISAEELMDKSRNPGQVAVKMERNGIFVKKPDDLEGVEEGPGTPVPAAGGPPPAPGKPA